MSKLQGDEVSKKLRLRAEIGISLLRELLPAARPIVTYSGWSTEERSTLGDLLTAVGRTSESAMLLVAYKQVWDAEMLSRSVTEGTLKFCYLLQRHSLFRERLDEYSNDLLQIAMYKDHKKAAELLEALPDPDAPRWKPIRDRILPTDELRRIAISYSSQRRRALETRWGFTGLISHLSGSGDPAFEAFRGFSHGYSISSHLQHVDYVGASLPMDRERRPPERRHLGYLVHGYRLISEIVTMAQVRLQVGHRYVGAGSSAMSEIDGKVREFAASEDEVYLRWLQAEYPDDFPTEETS